MNKKVEAAIRNLQLLKKDFNMKGANAQTVNSIIQAIRQQQKEYDKLWDTYQLFLEYE